MGSISSASRRGLLSTCGRGAEGLRNESLFTTCWRGGSAFARRRYSTCFRRTVKRAAWIWWIRQYDIKYDEPLAEAFRNHIESDRPRFLEELQAVCHEFRRAKRIHGGLSEKRYRMIGELRRRLADVCIDALEPDLVILDEFQRFKDLLNGQDEAAELAQQLFRHPRSPGAAALGDAVSDAVPRSRE